MLGLTGLFAPLVTPFTDDGETVSEVRLARLIQRLMKQGVSGFVCCTETGEFPAISVSERKLVLEILIREAHGVPVLAHCTRLGTSQALDLCQHAARHGARAAVVMPPYFGVFSPEEIEHHLRVIAQHSGLPVIVVDPQHLVRQPSKEALASTPNLLFAESIEDDFHARFAVGPAGPGSDEFVIDSAVVSPLIQIAAKADESTQLELRRVGEMMGRFGRARVAKAALNLMDVEVGPPRSPILQLREEQRRELASLLNISG